MTGNPASVSVLALAGFLGGLGLLAPAGSVCAQTDKTVQPDAHSQRTGDERAPALNGVNGQAVGFDIPAQSLDAALDAFATTSGRSVLFSSLLVSGRTSAAVRGRYAPLAALRLLVDGTGLDVEEVRSDGVVALVLKPADARTQAAAAASAAGKVRQLNYDGLIQAGIWQALCANPRTAAAGYRALLRFQVNPDGRVGAAQLLSSTGDRSRDRVLLDVIARVRIEAAPPADLRQPVTMLILPEPDGGSNCDSGGR